MKIVNCKLKISLLALFLLSLTIFFPKADASEEEAIGVTAVVEPIMIRVGELVSFRPERKIKEFPHFNFLAAFKNIGTFPLTYQGEITIFNMIGKEIKKIPFSNEGISVQPGAQKVVKTRWDSHLGFGFYTVFLDFIYAQGPYGWLTAQTTVWVIPWRVIIFILLIWFIFKWLYRKNT